MKDIQISQDSDGEKEKVSKLFHNSEVKFKRDKNFNEGLIQMPLDEDREVVIKKDFVMAVINLEVMSEVNIPVVSVCVVREKDFVKFVDDFVEN